MGIADVVARTTTALEPESDDTPPASLSDVLGVLGPLVLAHVTGPEERLDQPVGEPVVLGPGEPVPELGDELVFLTGGRESFVRVPDALSRVAAAGGRTVVVKSWGNDLAEASRMAAESGLTLW